MGHYVETDKIGKVWVSDVDDWFASLSNLISECRNYTVSEIRFQEILKKHNERVRADVIEKIKESIKFRLIEELGLEGVRKYGNKTAKQQANSYATIMKYEIADCVDDLLDDLEQLKEQKG